MFYFVFKFLIAVLERIELYPHEIIKMLHAPVPLHRIALDSPKLAGWGSLVVILGITLRTEGLPFQPGLNYV